MNTSHRPDPAFVSSLEGELRSTIRRQGRFNHEPAARIVGFGKLRWTTVLVALAAMCLGSAGTFAVAQRLRAETADLIIAKSEVQLEFANARLEMFLEELRERESRAAAGVLTPREVDSMRLELAHVETDAAVRALDVEEARITGRDPDNSLSAPILRGRDFVTERLELQEALNLQRISWIDKQASRPGLTPDESSLMIREQEDARAALSIVQQRLALRQEYLSGGRTPRQVELADMRFSVERQREMAARRMEESQRQWDRASALVEAGLASRSEVRAVEMELGTARLQLDLVELEIRILQAKLADPLDP
jgi:hypothetical protein